MPMFKKNTIENKNPVFLKKTKKTPSMRRESILCGLKKIDRIVWFFNLLELTNFCLWKTFMLDTNQLRPTELLLFVRHNQQKEIPLVSYTQMWSPMVVYTKRNGLIPTSRIRSPTGGLQDLVGHTVVGRNRSRRVADLPNHVPEGLGWCTQLPWHLYERAGKHVATQQHLPHNNMHSIHLSFIQYETL